MDRFLEVLDALADGAANFRKLAGAKDDENNH
jgi:hypothetical protein